MAATLTIPTGGASGPIDLTGTYDGLDNGGTITGGTSAAVVSNDHIETFINRDSGSMTSQTASVVIVDDTVSSFTNDGTIKTVQHVSSGPAASAVVIARDVGTVMNTGTVEANGNAYFLKEDLGDFTNSGALISHETSDGLELSGSLTGTFRNTSTGTITAAAEGVFVGGDLNAFVNEAGGSIYGDDAGLFAWGTVSSIANEGDISGGNHAFDLRGNVGSFTNGATGRIWSDAYDGTIRIRGTVENFNNSGQIWITGTSGEGVWFDGLVNSFSNSGTISGTNGGVIFQDRADSVVNSGDIDGSFYGLGFNGGAGTVLNTGTITGTYGLSFGSQFGGPLTVGDLRNDGKIAGLSYGVSTYSVTIGLLTNTGSITGGDGAGLDLDASASTGTTIVNSGTIEGPNGIQFTVSHAGWDRVTNSGTIRGLGGDAINFDYNSSGNRDRADTLTLLTGSKIFGTVNFGTTASDTHDSLDFSGFAGNTVLDVPGLDMVVPGARSYVWDQPNDRIAIFDLASASAHNLGGTFGDIVGSINDTVSDQLNTAAGGSVTPVTYAPQPRTNSAVAASEQAVMSELSVTPGDAPNGWASLLGGGSVTNTPVENGTLYGGLVAGTHARLSEMLQLGGLGGIVVSDNEVSGGEQRLDTGTALGGLYGQAPLGVADLDFSLTGGLSAHQSTRQVVAGGGTEIATGLFASAFAAPSVALSVPVLASDLGTVRLEAAGSYVGGLTTGYTETGSSMNLTVGSQMIGVLDARLGIKLESRVATAEGSSYTLSARAGLLARSNFGTASVPVSVWGTPLSYSAPQSSSFGAYGGVGVEGTLDTGLRLGAHLDASVRTDGVVSEAANVSLSGLF